MPADTYDELNDQFTELYAKEDYAGALDLLTREGERFPERAGLILYLRSCMAARTGQDRLALDIIRQALDKGHWYGEAVMRRSPSWESLQGLPEFEQLVEASKQRQEAEGVSARLLVGEPEGGCSGEAPCPAIVALHGNGMTGQSALEGWQPVTRLGYLLAAIQSSQAGMSDAFVWDDQETALRDVGEQYAVLKDEHTLDPDNMILAGFSLGAETALLAALRGTIPVKGFILLGPGGMLTDNPEEWLPVIEQAGDRRLRGYVFVGDKDNAIEPDAVRKTADMLNAHGIPCELEVLPGMRHEYPPDWEAGLKRAISFVAG